MSLTCMRKRCCIRRGRSGIGCLIFSMCKLMGWYRGRLVAWRASVKGGVAQSKDDQKKIEKRKKAKKNIPFSSRMTDDVGHQPSTASVIQAGVLVARPRSWHVSATFVVVAAQPWVGPGRERRWGWMIHQWQCLEAWREPCVGLIQVFSMWGNDISQHWALLTTKQAYPPIYCSRTTDRSPRCSYAKS